jgi:hypothetical protein
VAKTDKEKKVAERLGLAERDYFLMRCHLAGVLVWKKMFFSSIMPSRWDWRCGRIYDLILHMGKTTNYKNM